MRLSDSMIAVIAEPGEGKSALLAKIARDGNLGTVAHRALRERSERAYCRAGITPRSTRLAMCLLVLLAQLEPDVAERLAMEHDPDALRLDDVMPSWIEYLGDLRRGTEPAIVFDGFDKLTINDPQSHALNWMSTEAVPGAYFVVAADKGSPEEKVLRARPLTTLLELEPISTLDAHQIVTEAIVGHHRSLSEELVRMIVSKSTTPQWLITVTRLLLTLSQYDYLSLRRAEHSADPEAKLRDMLALTIDELPVDLDDLISEYTVRILGLADLSVTPALILQSVSMNGLREFDNLAIFGEGSKFRSAAPTEVRAISPEMLATTLDLFDGLIDIGDDRRWAFVSESVGAALSNVISESVVSVGGDPDAVVLHYRRLLIAHLLTLPLDDPVRTDELLQQLWIVGDIPFLAHALHDSDLTTSASAAVFGASLVAVTRDVAAVRSMVDVPMAPEDKLTLTALLIPALVTMDPAVGSGAAVAIKAVLEDVPESARSRYGGSAADLLAQLSLLSGSTGIGGSFGHFAPYMQALLEGRATLSQAPNFNPRTDFERRVFVDVQLTVAVQFALMVFNGYEPTNGEIVELAARRDVAEDLLDNSIPDDDMTEYLGILRSVCTRALTALGVPARSLPLVDDLERTEHGFDVTGGAPIFAVLLGACARVRSEIGVGLAIARGDALTANDLYRALQELDRARWRLEAIVALFPATRHARTELIAVLAARSAVLDAGEQRGSSSECVLRIVEHSLEEELLEPSDFVRAAGEALLAWCTNKLDGAVAPIVVRTLGLLDDGGNAGAIDVESRAVAEVGLLASAVDVGGVEGECELSLLLARRALSLEEGGYVFADGEATVSEILREQLDRVREELAEVLEVSDSMIELAEELVGSEQSLVDQCLWAAELFAVCAASPDAQVVDYLGKMLATMLAGALGSDAALIQEARWIHRSLGDFDGLDDADRRILRIAANHLAR